MSGSLGLALARIEFKNAGNLFGSTRGSNVRRFNDFKDLRRNLVGGRLPCLGNVMSLAMTEILDAPKAPLRARYLAAYRIVGLVTLPEDVIEVVRQNGPNKVSALLRTSVPAMAEEAARRYALGDMMLGMAFLPDAKYRHLPTHEERWAAYAADRQKSFDLPVRGAFLIVEAEDVTTSYQAVERSDELKIVFYSFSEGHFERITRGTWEAASAAIASAIIDSSSRAVVKVFEYYTLTDPIGTAYYNLSPAISASATTASMPPVEFARQVVSNAQMLLADTDLGAPARLLSEAVRGDADHLSVYLRAWSGLESLALAIFKAHHIWDSRLQAALPRHARRYFESSKKALDARLSLSDKFVIVAETLNPSGAAADIEQFQAFKKARDTFFHAPSKTPEFAALREFGLRYLALYLAQKQKDLS